MNSEFKRAVFMDRDGTIARDVPYCANPEQFELFPGTVKAMSVLNQHGLMAVIITNQSGIARGYFSLDDLNRIHRKLYIELAKSNVYLDGLYFCPHHPDDGCMCRKPKHGLFLKAASELHIDLVRSFMIGDQPKDIQAGKNADCRTILISPVRKQNSSVSPDYNATDILDAVDWVISQLGSIDSRGAP